MTPTEIQKTVLQIIQDEPELPGPIPDQLWEAIRKAAINNDRDLITETLRISVRLTKKNITEKIVETFKEADLFSPTDGRNLT